MRGYSISILLLQRIAGIQPAGDRHVTMRYGASHAENLHHLTRQSQHRARRSVVDAQFAPLAPKSSAGDIKIRNELARLQRNESAYLRSHTPVTRATPRCSACQLNNFNGAGRKSIVPIYNSSQPDGQTKQRTPLFVCGASGLLTGRDNSIRARAVIIRQPDALFRRQATGKRRHQRAGKILCVKRLPVRQR